MQARIEVTNGRVTAVHFEQAQPELSFA